MGKLIYVNGMQMYEVTQVIIMIWHMESQRKK